MKFVEESSWKWKQVVRLLLKNKPVFSSLSVPPNIQELFVVVDNGRKSLFHLKCGKFELLLHFWEVKAEWNLIFLFIICFLPSSPCEPACPGPERQFYKSKKHNNCKPMKIATNLCKGQTSWLSGASGAAKNKFVLILVLFKAKLRSY